MFRVASVEHFENKDTLFSGKDIAISSVTVLVFEMLFIVWCSSASDVEGLVQSPAEL